MFKFALVLVAFACLIFEAQSAAVCESHELFEECGTYCPQICGVPQPLACAEVCVQGCFCEDGYIRQSKTGPCIPLADCAM